MKNVTIIVKDEPIIETCKGCINDVKSSLTCTDFIEAMHILGLPDCIHDGIIYYKKKVKK